MRNFTFMLAVLISGCSTTTEQNDFTASDLSYFRAVERNDIKLSTPREGEWLFEHKESGQTLEQYKNQKPVHPNDSQNVIYLEPFGQFTPLQQKIFELTRQYVSIFFQMNTILLPPVNDAVVPSKYRRMLENDEQLLAPYILDTLLRGHTPKNSLAFMAFTAKDLYPQNDWNYVFGLASYTERVGVTSIYRLENSQLDSANFIQCLRRLINVSSHEIGHMLGLKHCTYARCVMNGSNSLPEADLSPNRFCSECQRKLFWAIKYDNRTRLKQLTAFFSSNSLKRDYEYSLMDLKNL